MFPSFRNITGLFFFVKPLGISNSPSCTLTVFGDLRPFADKKMGVRKITIHVDAGDEKGYKNFIFRKGGKAYGNQGWD